MSIFEYDEELHMKQVREEGHEEGLTLKLIFQIRKKMEKGLDQDTIAAHIEESPEFVAGVMEIMKRNPQATDDEVISLLK